jgi:uncharacterized damage-inducible protein DinB
LVFQLTQDQHEELFPMLDFLRNLMAHAEWANAVFFHAWGGSPARDDEEMRRRLSHLIGVQQGFLAMLTDKEPGGPKPGPPDTFDELKTRAQTGHAGLRNLVATMPSEKLSQTIRVPWFPDPPCVITVAEALVQVAMHSQHHRGQCMTKLKELGGEPKNVDWIIWLWKEKPEARWS